MPGTIPARPMDTTLDAECVQAALLRRVPVARRIHLALALSATVIGAARRAIARKHPHLSSLERDLLFVAQHYGGRIADELRSDLERRNRRHSHGA